MKLFYYAIAAAIIVVHNNSAEAFSVSSRKAFLSKISSATVVVATATPTIASAREGVLTRVAKQKAAETKARKDGGKKGGPSSDDDVSATTKGGSNEMFRGGKEAGDAVNFGEELNKDQSKAADGLMSKMGI